MKKITLIFYSIIILYSQFIQAKVQYDIKDPTIAATMGELVLSANTVEIFWHSYNHPSRPITPPQAMQRIIDDALLAQYARQTLPSELLNSANSVGFANDVKLEDRATALIRKTYQKDLITKIASLPKGLDSLFTFNRDISAKKLAELMTLKSALMIKATPEQEAAAKKIIIADIDFSPANLASSAQQLTLWDIYRRQNVQGRLAIHKADLHFLKAQVKQRIGSLLILAWAEENLNIHDYAAIKQILVNEQQKIRLLMSMGLHADVHDDNPALRAKAKTISEEKVKQFYQTNKDEFEVVEQVKARHIRVSSQELADQVVAEIKAGLDFSVAIEKYSIADDKNDEIPGSLGWLKRSDKKRSWLHAIAFMQQAGQVSVPFRSPQNQDDIVYEIILADERFDGHLPYSDPTVHYEASRDIALKELRAEFSALQTTLRNNADIHLNKAALK
ncbi:MAG: peptidylprolyl isomerase [Oleispira sp.]|nr:peptidylprolyl isomerase [Oleispira sp.]